MNRPLVSVIIPVYNSAPYLDACLSSLLSQSLRDIEIIAVNDGSKDDSLEILRRYEKTDARMRVIDQPNCGAGAARNAGLAAATGEYLSFLDSDDFYEPDMLEKAWQACKEKDADLCVFYADLFDNNTGEYRPCTWAFDRKLFPAGEAFRPEEEPYCRNLFQMFNGWPWDKLYRREFIVREGLEYQNLKSTNDLYFVFMAEALAGKIVTLDKCLIHQRVALSTSISKNRSWDCYYLGAKALMDGLKQKGRYEIYRQSYVNWVLHFVLWQLRTMQGDTYDRALELFKDKGFEGLDIAGHDRAYFYNVSDYDRLQHLMAGDKFWDEPYRNFKRCLKLGDYKGAIKKVIKKICG